MHGLRRSSRIRSGKFAPASCDHSGCIKFVSSNKDALFFPVNAIVTSNCGLCFTLYIVRVRKLSCNACTETPKRNVKRTRERTSQTSGENPCPNGHVNSGNCRIGNLRVFTFVFARHLLREIDPADGSKTRESYNPLVRRETARRNLARSVNPISPT